MDQSANLLAVQRVFRLEAVRAPGLGNCEKVDLAIAFDIPSLTVGVLLPMCPLHIWRRLEQEPTLL